ncbi:MAG: hypothetical protein IPF92_01485 [Myxococcales bacterium]|nr:hypothetical protein [Myxococcales bacterium]MBL0193804.1 hypothetical protein [Myxococcales bacterium]HQY61667.1 hypothetical protein [Polyangiaceae bacterium]
MMLHFPGARMRHALIALATGVAVPACGATPRPEGTFDAPADAAPSATATDAAPGPSAPPLFKDAAPSDAAPPGTEPPTEVDVVLTADNAYAFGWGDASRVNTYRNVAPARLAGEIFNCPVGNGPEAWVVPAADAPPGAFLYVVAWADRATSQGVIGQFRRRGGTPIFTGDGAWEGCATGREYNTSSAPTVFPTQDVVNEQITICNAGTGDRTTSSAGWVGSTAAVTPNAIGRVAFGEDNSNAGGTFQIVCQKDATGAEGVAPAAKWMWYSPDGNDPFRYVAPGNSTRTFLIFRLPARALPPAPPK